MIINQNISVIAEIFIYFRVSTADIPFTTCACNLGFMISDTMTLDKHISTVCRSAYLKIRRISSIRQYLAIQANKNSRLCLCSLQVRLLSTSSIWSAQFTFSVDYRKFRILQRNWFSRHANGVMCNLFCKLFSGYRSKPE